MTPNKDFINWLREYEERKHNPYNIGPNSNWKSKKYDIEGKSWNEISDIIIHGLPDKEGNDMTWGQACGALKHTWDLYNWQKRREGLNRTDLAFRIVRIQRAMGIEESVFPELDQEWLDHELSLEEQEEEEEEEDWENW